MDGWDLLSFSNSSEKKVKVYLIRTPYIKMETSGSVIVKLGIWDLGLVVASCSHALSASQAHSATLVPPVAQLEVGLKFEVRRIIMTLKVEINRTLWINNIPMLW